MMKDFTRPPLDVVLTWPLPNYVNPETNVGYLAPTTIVVTSVSLLIVTGRVCSRSLVTRQFGIDDWSMLLAMVFALGFSSIVLFQALECDIGIHIWDFPQEEKGVITRKTVWISEWFFASAAFFSRFSILIFYRRLHSGAYTNRFLFATWVGIVYNCLFSVHIPIFLVLIFRPIKSYWLSVDPAWAMTHTWVQGREDVGLVLNGVLCVIGDTYTALIPYLLVRSLHMPKGTKVRLYILFSSGLIVVAAGSFRTASMVRLVTSYDTTWNLPATWIWTVIELNVTIMAGSIPALKPLWARISNSKVSNIITHIRRSNPSIGGGAGGTPTLRSISKSSTAGGSDESGATSSTQAATLVEETITKIQTSPFSSPTRVPLKTRIANSRLHNANVNLKPSDSIPTTTITSLQCNNEPDRYHSPIPPPVPARTYHSTNPHHPIPQIIETRLSIQIESHPASPCLSPSPLSPSSYASFSPNHHPNRRYYYSPTTSSTPFVRPQTPTKSAAEHRDDDDDDDEDEDDEELSVPPYYQYRYAYDGPRTCRTWTRVVAARTGAGGWEGEAASAGVDDHDDGGVGSSSSNSSRKGIIGAGKKGMMMGNGKGRRWMGIGICDKQ